MSLQFDGDENAQRGMVKLISVHLRLPADLYARITDQEHVEPPEFKHEVKRHRCSIRVAKDGFGVDYFEFLARPSDVLEFVNAINRNAVLRYEAGIIDFSTIE